MPISTIIKQLQQTEHGLKHIIAAGDELLDDGSLQHEELATELLEYESYQARMLGTYMLGKLAPHNKRILSLLLTNVAEDSNWRVQEMLAKAIDGYCSEKGYEASLPEIKEWLKNKNPNVVRAVIEGLRVWTSRPYFKDNPGTAIQLIGKHRTDESEYVRKSVGNALRDISKKQPELIAEEIAVWDKSNPRVLFVYRLVMKNAAG